MAKKISFSASLHKIAIDHEGEVTLTLKVPASDLVDCIELAEYSETLLGVTVEPAQEKLPGVFDQAFREEE